MIPSYMHPAVFRLATMQGVVYKNHDAKQLSGFFMTPYNLRELLHAVKEGATTVDEALANLSELPFQDLGCAQVDHHRELRLGVPEMIFGEGKSGGQIARIMTAMALKGSNILVTRLS